MMNQTTINYATTEQTMAIVEELKNLGYNAELHVVNKNGVDVNGIRITSEDSRIAPIIYATPDDDVKSILRIYNNNVAPEFDNINGWFTPEYIDTHIRTGISKVGVNEYARTLSDYGYNDLEEYLYLVVESGKHEMASIRIKQDMIKHYNLDEEALWREARRNNNEETRITPMFDVLMSLSPMLSIVPEEDLGFLRDSNPMYVVTNTDKIKGASSILSDKVKKFVEESGKKWLWIPSSVHEVIMVPEGSMPEDGITQLVQEVNDSSVSIYEQLSDHVYSYNSER